MKTILAALLAAPCAAATFQPCPRFDQQHPNTYQTVLSELKDRRPSRAIMLSQQELAA